MIKISRLFKSFMYAFRGLFKTFREEQNLRIQTIAAVAVVVAGAYFKLSRFEWCVVVLTASAVILMELANSAVERITDVLKPRLDHYVKEIKDIMAAAVMVASIAAVIVGVIIFYPHLSRTF